MIFKNIYFADGIQIWTSNWEQLVVWFILTSSSVSCILNYKRRKHYTISRRFNETKLDVYLTIYLKRLLTKPAQTKKQRISTGQAKFTVLASKIVFNSKVIFTTLSELMITIETIMFLDCHKIWKTKTKTQGKFWLVTSTLRKWRHNKKQRTIMHELNHKMILHRRQKLLKYISLVNSKNWIRNKFGWVVSPVIGI